MRTSKAILGIIGGIAAGAIIGVLVAPDSGENTRKKIAAKSMGAVDDLKSSFNDLIDGLTDHREESPMTKNKSNSSTRKVHA